MHLKRHSRENSGLLTIADRLTFEPHRIRVDPTGHYEEGFDREFPFIIKRFYFRHQDFTPGLTWHERLELYLPLDGVARMQMGTRRVELRPGELLVVDNLQLHSTVDFPGLNSRVIVISFLPEFVYSLGSPSHDYFFLLPFYARVDSQTRVVRDDTPALPKIHEKVGQLLECYFSGESYYQAGCKAYFLELLFLLAQHFRASEFLRSQLIRQQERAARLKPVFDFISSHYSEPITLNLGATLAKMSQPSFTRLFKKVAGMTFVSYVTHVRLSRAMRLLKESSLTMAEVASEVGFSDQSYFDRKFRLAFGQTPSSARKNMPMAADIVIDTKDGFVGGDVAGQGHAGSPGSADPSPHRSFAVLS
jgi:AraC-like DNA-binding protein/mannose-6-phosphate isomerase-like protein (cupin superfamily)